MFRLSAAWLAIASFAVAPIARASELQAPETNPWRRAGAEAIERARAFEPANARRAKNVILFIGDGMGMTTITAARIFEGQRRGATGEGNQLAFETCPYRALAKTYSVNAQGAESAATATALRSGVKTNEEVIGLDERAAPNQHQTAEASRVETLLETAELRGLATGIVTTARKRGAGSPRQPSLGGLSMNAFLVSSLAGLALAFSVSACSGSSADAANASASASRRWARRSHSPRALTNTIVVRAPRMSDTSRG